MRFIHCVLAEWALVVPRFTRTRLGISLLALGATLVWLGSRGLDPVTVALLAGSLGAILGAAGVAGSDNERHARRRRSAIPPRPRDCNRSLGRAHRSAALLVIAAARQSIGGPALWRPGAWPRRGERCALAVVIRSATPPPPASSFIALAGAVAPERLVAIASPGFVRVAAASALELGPALWHYRDIVTGDPGALAHALAWTGLGVLIASAFIARRRSSTH
jgi:hypothetical protein